MLRDENDARRVSHRRGDIEVRQYAPPARSPVAIPRIAVNAAGATASVIAHLALLTPVIWDAAGKQSNPLPRAGDAADSQHGDEIALQLITIDLAAEPGTSRAPLLRLPPPRLTEVAASLSVPEITSDLALSKADAASVADISTAQSRGQYLGQIYARIDRAWLRPRSSIGDERFQCQVRIEQDGAGNISEVMLERCNGSAPWQRSLVHAIERASPLPAPPDTAAFAHAIHLSFQGVPIESAVAVDQYEPPAMRSRMDGH